MMTWVTALPENPVGQLQDGWPLTASHRALGPQLPPISHGLKPGGGGTLLGEGGLVADIVGRNLGVVEGCSGAMALSSS